MNQTHNMTTQPLPLPQFSAGSDPEILSQSLEPLLLPNDGRWTLTSAGTGLERSFKFKTFKKTWEFMNTIASQCSVQKHHPEWSNVYNTTFIRWTTHSPFGLSEKDIQMAKYCDEQALLHSEVEGMDNSRDAKTPCAESGDVDRDLADRVVVEDGDCCVPNKGGT
jgi:4a-hydroxytetrahydrobiopterin dehydratase